MCISYVMLMYNNRIAIYFCLIRMELKKHLYRLAIFNLVSFLLISLPATAQIVNPYDHDTTYYSTYPNLVTARFYFSKKYTNLRLDGDKNVSSFEYKPNTTLNLGIGATYKSLTLNLAYGFNFLNPTEDKGKTKYLDLQTHLYGRKWRIDFLGQFYKGYYLTPKGLAAPPGASYYVRPDLGITLIGLGIYKILNEQKFSYRAAMLQDEWQKKSAGSLLIGAEIYYGITSADSAFVPMELEMHYNQRGIRRLNFIEIGPGIGYAYTFVFRQHLFVTGSITLNIPVSVTSENSYTSKSTQVAVIPNYMYRFSAGYNGAKRSITFTVVENGINIRGSSSSDKYRYRTGNYRLTYAWRFPPRARLKQRLKFLDNVFENR